MTAQPNFSILIYYIKTIISDLKSRFLCKGGNVDLSEGIVSVGIAYAELVKTLVNSAVKLHKLLVRSFLSDLTACDYRDLVSASDC